MNDPRIKKGSYRKFRGKDSTPFLLKDEAQEVPSRRTNTSSGLDPYVGPWTEEQAMHLLKRCSFGVKNEEITQVVNLGLNDAIDLITTPNPNTSLPVNDYAAYGEDATVAPGETWVNAPHGEEVEFLRVYSLKNWILESYLDSSISMHEKMVLFWHNLIPTQFFLLEFANLSYAYYKILDNNAYGNFREIIKQKVIRFVVARRIYIYTLCFSRRGRTASTS